MTMKIHSIEYAPGVPAHPVFRAALEALPDAWPAETMYGRRGVPQTDAAGRNRTRPAIPWGVPEYVWISPHDRKVLGLPVEIGPGHPMRGILVTMTKKKGELPYLMQVMYEQTLPAGRMAFGSSYAHRTRYKLSGLFFFTWRCGVHQDCLENPALGQACCATRRDLNPENRTTRALTPRPRRRG